MLADRRAACCRSPRWPRRWACRPASRGVGQVGPAVIVAAGERRMAFVVDELLAEQEIIVKGLGARVRHARFFSGATILLSGADRPGPERGEPGPHGARPGARRALDAAGTRGRARRRGSGSWSSTTRSPRGPWRRALLEAAGYEVATAVDGEDGWRTAPGAGRRPPDQRRRDAPDGRLRADRGGPRLGAVRRPAGRPVHLARERADKARGSKSAPTPTSSRGLRPETCSKPWPNSC